MVIPKHCVAVVVAGVGNFPSSILVALGFALVIAAKN